MRKSQRLNGLVVGLGVAIVLLDGICVCTARAEVGQGPAAAAESAEWSSPNQTPTVQAAPNPPSRRSARADRLLKGGPPLTTFASLSPILERGHDVIVTDSDGRRMRGLISSVSSDGLVLFHRGGLFSRPREDAYRSDSIETIQIVDSHWNGVLIGLAAGVGIVLSARACSGECQGTAAYSALAGLVAPAIGWEIDDWINAPIYERGRPIPRVSIMPLYRHTIRGAVIRVGF